MFTISYLIIAKVALTIVSVLLGLGSLWCALGCASDAEGRGGDFVGRFLLAALIVLLGIVALWGARYPLAIVLCLGCIVNSSLMHRAAYRAARGSE